MTAIAAVVALVACGTDLGACPPGSEAQQSEGRFVVDAACAGCHAKSNEGVARFGAPSGLNWDNLGIVRDWSEDMFGEAQGGDMPPPSYSEALAPDQLEAMRIWLACGAQDVEF